MYQIERSKLTEILGREISDEEFEFHTLNLYRSVREYFKRADEDDTKLLELIDNKFLSNNESIRKHISDKMMVLDKLGEDIQKLAGNNENIRSTISTGIGDNVLSIVQRNNFDNLLSIGKLIDSSVQRLAPDGGIGEIKGIIENFRNEIMHKSVLKGKIGEINVGNILTGNFPDRSVEVMKTGGDFLIDENILIEVKNFDKSIYKRDLDKFIRDVTTGKGISIGILISLNTPIAKHGIFDILFENGKFMLLIAKPSENEIVNIVKIADKLIELNTESEGVDCSDIIVSIRKDIITPLENVVVSLERNIVELKRVAMISVEKYFS